MEENNKKRQLLLTMVLIFAKNLLKHLARPMKKTIMNMM